MISHSLSTLNFLLAAPRFNTGFYGELECHKMHVRASVSRANKLIEYASPRYSYAHIHRSVYFFVYP